MDWDPQWMDISRLIPLQDSVNCYRAGVARGNGELSAAVLLSMARSGVEPLLRLKISLGDKSDADCRHIWSDLLGDMHTNIPPYCMADVVQPRRLDRTDPQVSESKPGAIYRLR